MSKQPWDESLPGRHPALRDLTIQEEEVKAALGSSPLLTVEDKWKAHLLGNLEAYEANFNLFFNPNYSGKDKVSKVRFYRRALVEALGDLGRFDEALSYGCLNNKPFPGLEDIVAKVQETKMAVERSDDEECQCERPKAIIQDHRVREDSPNHNVEVSLNRRHIAGQVFSEKHGKMVSVWKCSVCGDMNAHSNIPERQVQLHNIRADIAARQRHLRASGMKITAQNWQHDPAHQDAVLLRD